MTFQSQPGEESNCIQLGYKCCKRDLQTIAFPILDNGTKDHIMTVGGFSHRLYCEIKIFRGAGGGE